MRAAPILILLLSLISIISCQQSPDKKFTVIPAESSGIHFSNDIEATDTFNVIDFYYIYNGGGVGIGDFNNDGLQDVYFAGNQVANEMYLNKGDFRFMNISDVAGVKADDIWSQGIAVIDINNDGWTDIYVCASIYPDSVRRLNKLFINNGLNSDGIPTFREEAAKWGIADHGHSANAAFFDYDLDGDLDLFIINNFMDTQFPSEFRPKVVDGSSVNSDKLYRNNGNSTFTDISSEAGILVEGYSHGIAIRDINIDGWPDVYITNDFLPNDVLYINNHDGTFTNKVSDYLKHQCFSAMGNDIADINNDGFQDIFALDMLPEMNYRKKTMLLKSNPMNQINYQKFNYDFQFIRNMLHLNLGPDGNGNMHFAEIGFEAGVFETDWSWCPLFADFDNDGYKDLFIANGFPGDVTDMDFANYMNRYKSLVNKRSDLFDTIPEVHIDNYIFKNNGDLTFTKMTEEWGLDVKTFSNGAAYADLDNDGDLDIITNNINEKATLYRNNTVDEKVNGKNSNFLRLRLSGPAENVVGIGASVLIYQGGRKQFIENTPYHGFMSSMDPVIHVGVSSASVVDSVVVVWPGGDRSIMKNLAVNSEYTITFTGGSPTAGISDFLLLTNKPKQIFQRNFAAGRIRYLHKEKDLYDFNYQLTIPHKLSQYTPAITVGDINGDGLEDVCVGGNPLQPATIWIQSISGEFQIEPRIVNDSDSISTNIGLLLFDADNDGDNDLYVATGGIEPEIGDAAYQDKLYLNDGNGYFTFKKDALPDIRTSSSCVKAADFDKDGDLDLFVGTRTRPGDYPLSEPSHLLINDGGTFSDQSQKIMSLFDFPLMVTDAIWTDFDNDSWMDLIVVGEWTEIIFLRNQQGDFVDVTAQSLQTSTTGWWNSIAEADIDNDGDTDYICGNLGLNSVFQGNETYPLSIYAKDFDRNGIIDPVIVKYVSDEKYNKRPYPIHTRDALLQQVPFLFQRVPTYNAFGKATIDDLFTREELADAFIRNGSFFQSVCLINNGQGEFELLPLPHEAQMTSVYGILAQDFDSDGNCDLLLVGNDYSIELMSGRIDACGGMFLRGKGDGTFRFLYPYESGFHIAGDAKGIAMVHDTNGKMNILTTQNKDSLITHSVVDRETQEK